MTPGAEMLGWSRNMGGSLSLLGRWAPMGVHGGEATAQRTWSLTNPCVLGGVGSESDRGVLCAFRSSNYVIGPRGETRILGDGGPRGDSVKARVWIGEIERAGLSAWALSERGPVEVVFGDADERGLRVERGIEDPRLFVRGVDDLWMSGVMLERAHTPWARMCVAYLGRVSDVLANVRAGGVVFARELTKLEIAGRAGGARGAEKNWATWVSGRGAGEEWMYSPGSGIVLRSEVGEARSVSEVGSGRVRGELAGRAGELRGGSGIVRLGLGSESGGGGGLCIAHWTDWREWESLVPETFGIKKGRMRWYSHAFCWIGENGGVEAVGPAFRFFRSGIEFAAGLRVLGDRVLVSLGREDIEAWVGEVDLARVLRSLESV